MSESEGRCGNPVDRELWLERGSWFVLYAGLGGVAARTVPGIFFNVFSKLHFYTQGLVPNQDFNSALFVVNLAQMLHESAIVVASFLLIRLLIIGVPAIIELKNSVIHDEATEDGAYAMKFAVWDSRFDRGSWFVLIAGLAGVMGGTALNTISTFGTILSGHIPLDDSQLLSFSLLSIGSIIRALYECAIIVSLFVLIRLAIRLVRTMVELRDAVILTDDDDV